MESATIERKPITAQEALEHVQRDAQSKVSDDRERDAQVDIGLKGRQGDVYYSLREEELATGAAPVERKQIEVAKSHKLTRLDGGAMHIYIGKGREIKTYAVVAKSGDVFMLKHPEHADHRITVKADGHLALWPQLNPTTMRQTWD